MLRTLCLGHKREVTVPGVPCGDRGIWDYESLRDRSNACFAKKAWERLRAFPKRVRPRMLSLDSVDYYGTSATEWSEKK